MLFCRLEGVAQSRPAANRDLSWVHVHITSLMRRENCHRFRKASLNASSGSSIADRFEVPIFELSR
jgi:hypothetical protein